MLVRSVGVVVTILSAVDSCGRGWACGSALDAARTKEMAKLVMCPWPAAVYPLPDPSTCPAKFSDENPCKFSTEPPQPILCDIAACCGGGSERAACMEQGFCQAVDCPTAQTTGQVTDTTAPPPTKPPTTVLEGNCDVMANNCPSGQECVPIVSTTVIGYNMFNPRGVCKPISYTCSMWQVSGMSCDRTIHVLIYLFACLEFLCWSMDLWAHNRVFEVQRITAACKRTKLQLKRWCMIVVFA